MHATNAPLRAGRRALALSALAGGLLAATLGLGADNALAAYTAKIQGQALKITGDAASDKLALVASAVTLALDLGADGTTEFAFDRDAFTAIDVDAGRGDDEVSVVGSLLGKTLTMDGGPGDDHLSGSNGDDVMVGGSGDDVLDGQQGNDILQLGGGNDRVQWDPGDGSDTVDGQSGNDLLDFNGSNIGETIGVVADGGRVRFTRNVANIVTDLDNVEQIAYDAFGGADTINIGHLAGTGMKTVDVDLGAVGGGGDAQPDTIVVNGTEGPDTITLSSADGRVIVAGLGTLTRVAGGEPAGDVVSVRTLGGDDTFGTTVGLGPQPVDADGGEGNDTARYSGTAGADSIGVFANGTEVTTLANPSAPDASGRLDTTAVESLVVLGLAGQDTISATGNIAALTMLTIDGGADGDILSGSTGPDTILGGSGDDVIDGQQGADTALLGGGGDDHFSWDPGDGSDTVEGGAGGDTLVVNGSSIAEAFDVSANGSRSRLTRNIALVTLDFDDVEALGVHTVGGADVITVNDLAGTDLKTVDVDLSAVGGGGDAQPDTVAVRGTEGADTVAAGSSEGAPLVSGLAAKVRVTGGEEAYDNINVETLGESDTVSAGIGVAGQAPINVDGGEGTDTVAYKGTAAADTISVVANGAEVSTVASATARLDTIAVESLVVSGLDGPDTITATGNIAPLTKLTIDGGAGDDVLSGSNGPDTILGGSGDDAVDGQQGADTALLGGGGDDRFQWDPGDGSDAVDGQGGNDRLDLNGSSISETLDASAAGSRVRVTRNIGLVTLDLDDVEALNVRAVGGADIVTVNDLSGTGLKTVDVDLSVAGGGGDAQPDTVVVNGTDRADVIDVARSGSQVLTSGLAAQTRIAGSDPTLDTLRVQALDGDDDVSVAPDVTDLIVPVLDLGMGE
jgi:hypothetical protein